MPVVLPHAHAAPVESVLTALFQRLPRYATLIESDDFAKITSVSGWGGCVYANGSALKALSFAERLCYCNGSIILTALLL